VKSKRTSVAEVEPEAVVELFLGLVVGAEWWARKATDAARFPRGDVG